jgi:NitT/TauT family transport system substrate-binding protein
MSKFVIRTHGRLQEWVAHEKGYFSDEGLDYTLGEDSRKERRGKDVDAVTGVAKEIYSGAYESYQRGNGNKGDQTTDISCACHWTVNNAAASDHGKMWANAYTVTPGSIVVPASSPIRRPEDLAGKDIAAGYHSGSHYTTLQALEPFLKLDDIKLKFMGLPWQRLDACVDGDVPAASVWGMSHYVAEQLGLRKIVDATFMIGFMVPEAAHRDDVEKYFRALKRAQMDIDLEVEKYKPYYSRELPERYHAKVDVRLFGPGERIVFLPYSKETFDKTQQWIHERRIFDTAPQYDYDKVVCALSG